MTGQELFHLINSLSRREKSNFAKFSDSNAEVNQGGRRPRYLQLFDRLARIDAYREEEVRGTLFRSSVKFYQAREKLLDKIIQSLVYYGEDKLSARSYILQALKVDAVELAQKRLVAELEQASRSQDSDYLHYLLTLKRKVEANHHLKIELPDHLEDLDEIESTYPHLLQLRLILRRLLSLIRSGKALQPGFGPSRFLAEAENIPRRDSESRYLYHKIRSSVATMSLDMEEAYFQQKEAVQELEQVGAHLRHSLLAKEYFVLVQLSIQNNDPDLVQQTLFKFSQLEPDNQREHQIKHDYWIQAAVSAGDIHANLDLIRMVVPFLQNDPLVFSHELLILNLFLSAKVFFVHKEYEETLKLIQQIRQAKKSKWVELNWAVESLRYMTHSEMGNHDVLESIYRSSLRLTDSFGGEMARFSCRTMHKASATLYPEERARLHRDFLDQLAEKSEDPIEMVPIDLLDLSFWLEHHAVGTPLRKAFLKNAHQRREEKAQRSATGSL